jgi:hypothetical protein
MDDDENDEIAAAMGFASFGGTKKRKFDHATSPKASAKADASGANSTKLGVRTKTTADTEKNGIEGTPTSLSNQAAQALPSAQPKAAPEPAANSGLASFLARAQTLPNKPPGTVEMRHLPPPSDHSTTEMLSFGGPSISRVELNALRNGVRNENGDTAYFLPSFVEDPWEKLAKGARV